MTKKSVAIELAAKLRQERDGERGVKYSTASKAAGELELQNARIAELEAELAALKAPAPIPSNSAEFETATPWYPDDSGEWVEVPEDLEEWPPGLEGPELIEVLTRGERDHRRWDSGSDLALWWDWAHPRGHSFRTVAYKVVKP